MLEILSVGKRQAFWAIWGAKWGFAGPKKKSVAASSADEKGQREYYLNEQLKAIQKELGEGEDGARKFWARAIAQTKLSKEAREKADAELKKLNSWGRCRPKPPSSKLS